MLSGIHSVFFVGIKGVAMTNLARILKQMGKQVSGSDVADTFITDPILQTEQISVIHSFEAQQLPPDIDLVVYAASHSGRMNPQVIEAQKRGVSVVHQAELLGRLSKDFETTIAVSGCHGKTTTSSLLTHALIKLKASPSYMVGVSQFGEEYGGAFGGENCLVLEADEYGIDPPVNTTPKFHLLESDYAIVTNIDHDHPDIYPTFEDTKKAFLHFMQRVIQKKARAPQLFLCADDPAIRALIPSLMRDSYLTYGTAEDADLRISDIQTSETETRYVIESTKLSIPRTPVKICLFGEKNVLNATAVIAVLLHIGYSIHDITEAIHDFHGSKRRFELIARSKEIYLFDDYAHHPHEIEATIEAARKRFPDKKLIIIFQPHTFSRTTQFAHAFVSALSKADKALLLPVFESAREKKTSASVTHADLAQEAHKKGMTHVQAFENTDQVITYLQDHLKQETIIFTMGAGDVYQMKEEIIPLLNAVTS